ncbi:MAG: DUF4870 domain-containing protein [Phycisphaerales bacterium]
MSQSPSTIDAGVPESQRGWGVAQHLIGLLSLLDLAIAGLIGAIIMWRIKTDESDWLDDHGREAVNFQLSLLLYAFVGSIVIAILSLGIFAVFTLPVWLVFLWILRLYGCIKGAIVANRGGFYRYPMTIRFISPRLAG